MSMTVSSELKAPKCMPDAFNIMIYSGTLNLGTYAADGIEATDISNQFRYLLFLAVLRKGTYSFDYVASTNKVRAFVDHATEGVNAEVAGTPDLSTTPGDVQFLAIGLRT